MKKEIPATCRVFFFLGFAIGSQYIDMEGPGAGTLLL